jgi:hypothetical protein
VEKPISKSSIFIDGAARFKDLIYLIAKDRGLVSQDIVHSRFIAFDQLKFAHMGDRNWNAVAICVAEKPTKKMVAVGEDGDVVTYTGGKLSEELIDPRPAVLRGIGVVDGIPFACGMKRQVYRRIGESSWLGMHAPAPGAGENAGFEAIGGFTGNEIYAVGWNGEIWQWDGVNWINHSSPTNLILTGVWCGADEQVYICGQHGTLIRGRYAAWEVVDLEDMIDDLWDLYWFNDRLYVATMTMLYTFADDHLDPVIFGADRPRTCYRLTAAEGVLWSVGSDDVFSFDGAQWTRVD